MTPPRLPRSLGLQPPAVRPESQSASSRAPPLRGLPGPTLRANPFPEVTDLSCRLPLSTLFYRLEAAHLGDLMRL